MLGSPDKQIIKSAKRTTEVLQLRTFEEGLLERLDRHDIESTPRNVFHWPSAVRFTDYAFISSIDPTDKSVGYFHFVRFADEDCQALLGKALSRRFSSYGSVVILFLESEVVDHESPFFQNAFITVHPDGDGC